MAWRRAASKSAPASVRQTCAAALKVGTSRPSAVWAVETGAAAAAWPRGLPPRRRAASRIGEGGDQTGRAQAVLARQAMGDGQGGGGFGGQGRAQGGGAHAALGQAAQHGLALLGEGGIDAEHRGGLRRWR
jgi:hypothetical protein